MSLLALPNRPGFLAVAALLLSLLVSSRTPAQNAAVDGLFISVENPITEDSAKRIQEVTTRAVQRHRDQNQDRPDRERRTLKIVFDFTPNNAPANSMSSGCGDLCEYLLRLHDVTTIAFVHGEVSRHSVAPVLACKDIVMSKEAKIGPVFAGKEERPLTEREKAAYGEIIRIGNRNPAVVLKLLDPDMEVLEARNRKDGGVWFIDASREAAEEKAGYTVTQREPVVGRGPGIYTAALAERLGLCKHIRESRQQLAEAYQLPIASLREDPLLGRPPVVWKVRLTGPVNPAMYESLKRRARQAIGRDRHANFLILQLDDCGGGDLETAYLIAKLVRDELKQDDHDLPVKTIAYVPRRAPDTAAVIALGCNEIVLGKGAEFGDFGTFASKPGEPINQLRLDGLRKLAGDQNYPPLLVQGFLDRELTLYYAKSVRGVSEWKLLDDEELKKDRASKEPRWGGVTLVKEGGPNGKLLVLSAEMARDVGLVRHVVDGVPQLYESLGIKESQVTQAGSDWIDDLLYFLRRPEVSILLVVVGFICMILELKIPGVTLPGVISAVCFLLFFYAWSPVAGHAIWLAILLFALALVLIGLEIFVLPGFGVVGVSGVILLVLSLALVTLEKKPETSHEWAQLGSWMLTFGGCFVGAIAAAFTLIWYLPNIPYLNRLMLRPAAVSAEDDVLVEPQQPPLARLLGDIGVAATPLRPAGKVKFGDEFVDVLSEGGYIAEGTRVQVIEIEGPRIVVKEV